ncbi:MAG: thermonuclease family protein [Alphaproteobacteria bacterium]|nr:thermonuclease family protein [Alphaproteobacteria bacterium]
MGMKLLKFVAVVLAVVFGMHFFFKDVSWVSAGENVYVVDGDSLEVDGKRIRLVGIDSPEYKQFCYNKKHQKYDCGIKAKEYMEELVFSHSVDCKEESVDMYGRSLSVCFADGKNLNEEMIKAGWALAYRSEGDKYAALEKEAKANKRGVWQGRFMRPELYRFLLKRKNS